MNPRIAGLVSWKWVLAGLLVLAMPHPAWAQVKLEYKFPEGQKLTYKSQVKTSQVLTLMGQDIQTESAETIVSSLNVGKKRPDHTLPVEDKVESLTVDLSLPGGIKIGFDSKNPDAKADNPQLAALTDAYKLISQMRYTVVLDDHNKVKAVEGTEKILEKAEGLNEIMKQSLRGRFDAQRLKAQFEQSHGNLPDVLARKGEPWERTETLEIGGGQTLTFQKKYEYAGEEKKGDAVYDKIDVKTTKVTYAMDPNAPSPLKVIKSDLIVPSGDGVILFDRAAGRVVSSRALTRMKGPMTFAAGGQEIPGELDLTIEVDTELVPEAK